MPVVKVEQTDDTAVVLDLLTRWKTDTHAFVRSDRMVHWVARLAEQPVGVLTGTHDFGNWSLLERYQHLTDDDEGSYVTAMFVEPALRSHGIGAALLRAFVAQARSAGSPVVVAWPDEDEEGREERVRFFERNGFAFLDFPGGVHEPWLMGLPLNGRRAC
ncbi:GNAT family N-acetyltransferase [Geodermatophilus sp. FMUSA9-8]|uniref:GNAT family N-acetyltransferase n=1 Tax=Geodermatophilus sp. FMUSA9-8 TaxID=3120155 RepID=UPI00300BBD4A